MLKPISLEARDTRQAASRARNAIVCMIAAISLTFSNDCPADDNPPVKLVEVNGSTVIALLPQNALTKSEPFHLPVTLGNGVEKSKVKVSVVGATYNGRHQPTGTTSACLAGAPDSADEPVFLKVTVDLQKFEREGKYDVAVQVATDTQKPQGLSLTLVRPAAVLRGPTTTFRAELVVFAPHFPGGQTLIGKEMVLRETGGESAVTLTQNPLKAELTHAAQKVTDGHATLTVPPRIDAWGQKIATLGIEGTLPLGESTGSFTVHSNQLAARSLEIPIHIVTRLHLVYLLAAIVLAIGLGYWVRTKLEDSRLLLAARIAAAEVREDLQRVSSQIHDPEVYQKLAQIDQNFHNAINASNATPETIKTATEKAKIAYEEVLTIAAKQRTELTAKIAAWRRALGVAESQPPKVAGVVQEALGQLDAQEEALATGSAKTVNEFFNKFGTRLEYLLREGIEGWERDVDSALGSIGMWPDTKIQGKVDRLTEERRKIGDLLKQSITQDNASLLLPAVAKAWRTIQYTFQPELKSALAEVAEKVAITLRTLLKADSGGGSEVGPNEDEQDEAAWRDKDPLEESIRKLEKATDRVKNAANFEELGQEAKTLHDRLRKALTAAHQQSEASSDPQPLEWLTTHNYLKVLNAVTKKHGVTSAGVVFIHARNIPDRRTIAEPETLPLTTGAVSSWSVAIQTPGMPVEAGTTVTLTAIVQSGDDQSQPPVRLTWWVDDRRIKQATVGDMSCHVTPNESGRLTITVQATADDGSEQTAVGVVEVLGSIRSAMDRMQKRLKKAERIQSFVTGSLIALAGYIMFKQTFVGSAEDFFAAGLWGFTIDIGLANVRHMAAPLLTRTPKFPGT